MLFYIYFIGAIHENTKSAFLEHSIGNIAFQYSA